MKPSLTITCLFIVFFSQTSFSQTYELPGITTSVPRKWTNFDLGSAQLTNGSYAKARQDQNLNYLLSLDEERLLKSVMLAAGMANIKPYYGGWQANGNNGFGNYLSALSMMYVSTGNTTLLTKINNMVNIIDSAQRKESYLGGYFYINQDTTLDPYPKLMLANDTFSIVNNGEDFYTTNAMAQNAFYNLHRVFAGIRDAYVYAGVAKAKLMFLKTMDWLCTWTNLVTTDDALQRYLKCEHGGILELLADAYALSNDIKYKNAAARWIHRIGFADNLAANQDILRGKHANAQDPKFPGLAWYYELTGDTKSGMAARNALNFIIDKHTLPNGGHGFWERYVEPGKYTDHLGYSSSEQCCTYNIIKFARNMINLDGQVKYMDLYERMLYNHIMGAVDPTTTSPGGGFTYYTGLGPGMWKSYMTENLMACDWETGLESHSKYGEGIYFSGTQGLLVNLYLPSTLNWPAKGFQAVLKTAYPENDTVKFVINTAGTFNQNIYFRIPGWLKQGDGTVYLNSVIQTTPITPGTLLSVSKTPWVNGDSIMLVLPRRLRLEPSEKPNVVAIFCGPVLLAPDLGPVPISDYVSDVWTDNGIEQNRDFPVLNASKLNISTWLQKNADFSYTTQGLSTNYTYKPLYATHHREFSIYSRIADSSEQAAEQYFITDRIIAGDSANETAHNMMLTGTSSTGVYRAHRYRNTSNGGTISYTLKVSADSGIQHYVMFTYFGFEGANQGNFNVYIDNNLIGNSGSIERLRQFAWPKGYFMVPKTLTQGKNTVTLKIESTAGNIASFYGIAMVTDDYLNISDPDSKISSPRLEAERAQHFDGEKFPPRASAGADMANINRFVQFNNVYARKPGTYTLNVAYAAGSGATTSYVLNVNGATQTLPLPLTSDWNTFNVVSVSINLNAGMNQVRIQQGTNYADLDYIEIIGLNNSNNIISEGIYKIVSKNSGKVMHVDASSTANGGRVSQTTWTGVDNQKWNVKQVSPGKYSFFNVNSGKALDVAGLSFANGAQIWQWDYLSSTNQQWYITEDSNGYYKIQNVNSGKVVDVEGASILDSANISQYKWTGRNNQLWSFQLVNTLPSGLYRITAKHSGKSLEVNNGTLANGDSILQRDYAGQLYQQWNIQDVGGGYYKILAQHTGKAMDVLGGPTATADGVQVDQWDYLGGDNQKWAFIPMGDGFYKIIAKHSNKLLEITGQSIANGARADQWTDLGLDNQLWKLERVVTTDYTGFMRNRENNNIIVENAPIRIFPNPAVNNITVIFNQLNSSNNLIRIFNSLGQLVYMENVPPKKQHIISLVNFKKGLYFITINEGGSRYSQKLEILK